MCVYLSAKIRGDVRPVRRRPCTCMNLYKGRGGQGGGGRERGRDVPGHRDEHAVSAVARCGTVRVLPPDASRRRTASFPPSPPPPLSRLYVRHESARVGENRKEKGNPFFGRAPLSSRVTETRRENAALRKRVRKRREDVEGRAKRTIPGNDDRGTGGMISLHRQNDRPRRYYNRNAYRSSCGTCARRCRAVHPAYGSATSGWGKKGMRERESRG